MYRGWTPEYLTQARKSFARAIDLDPDNVEAMVWLAITDLILGTFFFENERAVHIAAGEAILAKALCLSPNHAWAHMMLGAFFACTNRAALAIPELEHALALNPNLAEAHAEIGAAKYYLGRGAEVENHIKEAFRISPRDTFAYRWMMLAGFGKIEVEAYAEGIYWLRRSIEANPNQLLTHFFLAGALAVVGSVNEAKAAASAGLAHHPSFTLRRYRDGAQSDNPIYLAMRKRIYEGMRLAGIPEG